MRTIVITAALLTAAAMAMAAGDAGGQAKKDFDELFGTQVRAAKNAPQPNNDLKLAGQILDAAKGAAISPELMTLLCDAVCDLAGSTPPGQDLALQAAGLLTKASPDKASHAQRKLLDVGTRLYNAATGQAKEQAGQDLIERLLALAEAPPPGGEPAQAAGDLKAAEQIATQIVSPLLRPIRGKILMQELTAAGMKKAAALQAKLKANPSDSTTQDALVKVLLLELDRPAEAAKSLSQDSDTTLRTNIPLAAGAPGDLAAGPCFELAQWYDALAAKATGAGVPNALRRARTYYQRFLEVYTEKDTKRLLAQAQLKKVETAMEKYEPKADWVNVLGRVDLLRHVRWGTWAWGGTALGITRGAPRSRVVIPVIPDGNYELMATFSRAEGLGSTRFYLPTGGSTCLLVLGADKDQICGLDRVDGSDATKNATRTLAPSLAGPAKHTVCAKVICQGEKVDISVTLDEKDLFTWSGASMDLSRPLEWALSDAAAMGLGAGDARVIYHSVQVRMLSGKLKISPADESAARRAEEARNRRPIRARRLK